MEWPQVVMISIISIRTAFGIVHDLKEKTRCAMKLGNITGTLIGNGLFIFILKAGGFF